MAEKFKLVFVLPDIVTPSPTAPTQPFICTETFPEILTSLEFEAIELLLLPDRLIGRLELSDTS
jgi:hypothetical protein